MQELKRRPRPKIVLIAVLSIGLIALFSYFGFGNNDSSTQIQTAKAEYFPTADGNWMIQNIIPLTKNLYGVSCASLDPNSGFCFAVGENGTLVKYLGLNNQAIYKWLAQPSFTTKTLRGITCLSATNCYAVGGDGTANSGEIWAYNGTSWSRQAYNVGSLNGIGCLNSTCFALGNNGLILKQTGNSWMAMNSGTTNTLNSFSCYSANLCFAVGAGGTILNYDGTNWSSGTSGTTVNLNSVSCYSQHYCFAVGNNGVLLKYDGTSWTSQTSGTTNNLNGIYCDYYCYGVGDAGTALIYNAVNWSVIPSHTSYNLRAVYCGVACPAVGDIGETLIYDGENWLRIIGGQETQTFPNLGLVSCPAVGTCFAVGKAGLIVSFNGQSWSQQNSGTTTDLYNINCPGVTSCFAVGSNGLILHYDGANWNPQNSGTTNELNEIQCPSLTVCYAAGVGGIFLHYDGTNWSPLNPGTTSDFRALSCPTTTDCYGVIGSIPLNLVIYNGTTWAFTPITNSSNINSLSCPAISNCFILDSTYQNPYLSRILHYDGTNITVSYQTIPTSNTVSRFYLAIACPTTTDCTAVGTFGVILHYDGLNWSTQLSGTLDILNGISCPIRDYCVVVGSCNALRF